MKIEETKKAKEKTMGLSNFSSPAEGVIPVLVMNTVASVALFKNAVRSTLHPISRATAGRSSSSSRTTTPPTSPSGSDVEGRPIQGRVSITQFKRLVGGEGISEVECCVCLCGFEGDEEVSELSCKHFFHKGCLEKWFRNRHSTCPLCRSRI